MKRRRKIITRVIVFLILGAIVNVGVAWGCALRSLSFGGSPRTALKSQWPRIAPPDFPDIAEYLEDDKTYGFRQIVASAHHRYISTEARWSDASDNPLWIQGVFQCGLPCLSLEWTADFSAERTVQLWNISGIEPPIFLQRANDNSKRLAYSLLWPGFAINTAFYALLLWFPFALLGFVKRQRRMKRGLCLACAYPVGVSEVCTECGRPVGRWGA